MKDQCELLNVSSTTLCQRNLYKCDRSLSYRKVDFAVYRREKWNSELEKRTADAYKDCHQ